FFFFFQAEDGIRDKLVTGVQTCALPSSARILMATSRSRRVSSARHTSPIPPAPSGAMRRYVPRSVGSVIVVVRLRIASAPRPRQDRKSVGEGKSVRRGGWAARSQKERD